MSRLLLFTRQRKGLFALLILIGAIVVFQVASCIQQAQAVDFNTEIRPILNAKCITCHGGVKRSGGFSLLFRQDALQPNESGHPGIVPGNPDESEMLKRLVHHDPEMRMPLDAEVLPQEEIDLLTKWIEQGAEWKDHWAYVAPKRIQPPNVNGDWARNEIDQFIQHSLNEANLAPSDEADRTTLIRRVSLDLTGLPPTPEEVTLFANDESQNAYESMVDRYLASPRYGEKWASMWLDLARYADSKGYEKDAARTIWPYRDWVIKAFNQDLPFDQFTIEQLAGDLLPNPTDDQLIATGFHRNTMNNDEGGTDDEEFRVAAIIDRVNTTFDVWQGVSIGCVQCHSHPYDPFRHKEYYQLMAFFNQTEDADKPSEFPTLKIYSPEKKKKIEEIANWVGKQKPAIEKSDTAATKTPIMRELSKDHQRITQVFDRGNWLVKRDTVQPMLPGSMPDLPEGSAAHRLGFAKWLVSPENPLTARVAVNRFWEQIFGRGIVLTLEDFGTQGIRPSHPELLDWMAVHLREDLNWSIKALLKEIMMSSTYRQSAKVSPEMLAADPENILLGRAPRIRLSAEQIRDQALAVSGLLSDKMYGPSVMPPQPDGIWQAVYNSQTWETSEGEDQYRRAVYTYWRRTSPYPSMISFDSPSREFCLPRRIRTNTPLQALITLNDPVYIEAAQALAAYMKSSGELPENWIKNGYIKALMKTPNQATENVLMGLYADAFANYESDDLAAKMMAGGKETDTKELAALTVVANAIMNLDGFIMKE